MEPEPDLPYVEQQRALAWGLLASAGLLTVVTAADTDPWWVQPLVFAVLAAGLLPIVYGFARASSGSWLDSVERIGVAPRNERASAARWSGLLRTLGVLGIVGAVTVVAWPLTGRISGGPFGALVGVGLGAAHDTWRARTWEAEHGLRLYVRAHARRLTLTRAHRLERLVAAPVPAVLRQT